MNWQPKFFLVIAGIIFFNSICAAQYCAKRHKGYGAMGVDDNIYILRSNLDGEQGYFLRAGKLLNSKPKIFLLPKSFSNKDFYLGVNGRKYAFNSSDWQYVSTPDLQKGTNLKFGTVSPAVQGGDHYFGRNLNGNYKIYKIKGNKFWRYESLESSKADNGYDGVEIPTEAQGALFFWCHDGYVNWIADGPNGPIRYKTEEFKKGNKITADQVPNNIMAFMEGGLAVTEGGPTDLVWKEVKSYINYSTTDNMMLPVWSETVTIGVSKEKMSSFEHYWEFSIEVTSSSGKFTESIAKTQVKFGAKYGGKNVETTTENWSETRVETIGLPQQELKPGQGYGIFRGVLTIGGKEYISGRSYITSTGKPPIEPPKLSID